MAIQIKRGLYSALPILTEGEKYWATDTKVLYIGNGDGSNIAYYPTGVTPGGVITKSFYSGVLTGGNVDNEIVITNWNETNYRILLYDEVNQQDAIGIIKYPDAVTPKTKLHLKVFEAVLGNGYIITLISTNEPPAL